MGSHAINCQFDPRSQSNRLTGAEIPCHKGFINSDGVQSLLRLSGLASREVGWFESSGIVFVFSLAAFVGGFGMGSSGSLLQHRKALIELGNDFLYQVRLVHFHPPAKTGRNPASSRIRATSARLSPWISMRPSLTVPPVPQAFCIFLASNSFSGSPMPTKCVATVTVFPPRPAVWRMMSTRPRSFRFAEAGAISSGDRSEAWGSPALLSDAKGAWKPCWRFIRVSPPVASIDTAPPR